MTDPVRAFSLPLRRIPKAGIPSSLSVSLSPFPHLFKKQRVTHVPAPSK